MSVLQGSVQVLRDCQLAAQTRLFHRPSGKTAQLPRRTLDSSTEVSLAPSELFDEGSGELGNGLSFQNLDGLLESARALGWKAGSGQDGCHTAGNMTGRLAETSGERSCGHDRTDAWQHERDCGQDMAAQLAFAHLHENPLQVGKIKVYWELMNHPGATIGFRIEMQGARIAYVTDNEFLKGYMGPPHVLTPASDKVVPYQRIIQFVSGADVLIMEAQYTNEEYPKKVGWGHTCLSNGALLVKLAKVKKWIVTHHDPMHDDDFLITKLDLTRQILRSLDCRTEVANAFDGMTGYL